MRNVTSFFLTLTFLAAVATGCGGDQQAATTPGEKSESAGSGNAEAVAAALVKMPPGGKLGGIVRERIDASTYTYLRLETPQGELWAAVPSSDVAVGSTVGIDNPMPMDGFESTTLQRRFEHIVFGTLAGTTASAAAGGLPPGHPPTDSSTTGSQPTASKIHSADTYGADTAGDTAGDTDASPPAATRPAATRQALAVEKAHGADARTVAETWAERTQLANKTVTIRGQVVKFNGGILGKNWLHLRDGSGSEATNDHDITVTTQGTAAVGDIVVIKGTVYLDKDFGAGYAYPLIIEEATVEVGSRSAR